MKKCYVGVVGMLFTLSGCTGLFETMNRMPVDDKSVRIENDAGDRRVAASIATDPTRRLVIFNGAAAQQADGNSAYICAEPPPDTALNVLSETRAAVEAAAKSAGGASDPKVGASLASSIEQMIVSLATRTELVEIYRSATYSLCQLHMNGALDGKQTADAFREITGATITVASNSVSGRAGLASGTLGKKEDSRSSQSTKKSVEPDGPVKPIPPETSASSGAQ